MRGQKYYAGRGPKPRGYRLPEYGNRPAMNSPEAIEKRRQESEARIEALRLRLKGCQEQKR